jgi:hypothetical protein
MQFRRKILLIILFCILLQPASFIDLPTASANEVQPQDMPCGMALVDGVIKEDEWPPDAAHPVSLVGNTTERSATIYLMNSQDTLYLGLQVVDDELSYQAEWLPGGDAIRLDLDNDSNQQFDLLEDVLIVNAAFPTFQDSYLNVLPSSSQIDELAGGETNGSGHASRQEPYNQFELGHPLCSADQFDICLQAGDTLTLRLEFLDAEADGSFGGSFYYPQYPGTLSLLVTECPVLTRSLYLPLMNK